MMHIVYLLKKLRALRGKKRNLWECWLWAHMGISHGYGPYDALVTNSSVIKSAHPSELCYAVPCSTTSAPSLPLLLY